MSYNVDNVSIIASSGFRILKTKLAELNAQISKDRRPESNLLYDERWATTREDDGYLYPKYNSLWWNGEGSGHTFDDVFAVDVLPHFEGSADLVITWEGGDSFSGLRLVDGKVTKHKVVQALGDEEA